MHHFRTCTRILAWPLIAVFLITTVPLAPARAAFVSTEDVLRQDNSSTDREKVAAFLQRQDVRQQLALLGVDAREADARVATLSDQEIAKIAGKIDRMPAGQGVEVVLVVALIVLLVVLIFKLVRP
jgi:Family of unknown function (DUF6627)